MARLSRLALILIAVVLAAGLTACGGDDDSAGSPPKAATSQPDTGTATEPTPAEAQEALKDTSQKPAIPKPTGSPPRKLVVEDIVKGKGKAAKKGDTVIVNYVGENFSNGKEFDASWDRGQPFPVTIGRTQVIEGWTRGLVGIKKGGRRMLTIPPELGYGPSGYPPAIPPNETLIFVVDAVSVR
ncbi:MAG TPA: FKBP-type peptidyl-prolyl cis-trans isomerase [Thermoleophilaceae bacterium]